MVRSTVWGGIGTGALALCLLWGPGAQACSVCGCGDPLVAAADSAPSAGALRLAFDWEYLTASAQSDEDPTATEQLTQMTFRPEVVYSPIARLNLLLQVPLVRKDWTLESPSEPEAAQPFGLGDVDVGARYFVFEHSDLASQTRQELALSAGTSLPTGADDVTVDGERIDDHAQPGTGAFGPYAGLLYAWHRDPWNLSASLSGRVHSRSAYGYHYGSALLWSISGLYRPFERAGFELGVDGRWAGRDDADGELQANTGGMVLALAPGVRVNPAGNLWLNARAQIPVATHLFGVQTVGPTVTVGAQYAF
jgi:hypothetical protein